MDEQSKLHSKKRKLEEKIPTTPPGSPPESTPNKEEEMVPKAHYDQLIKAQEEIIQKMKSDITQIRDSYRKKIDFLKKENEELKKLKQQQQ